MRKYVCSKCGTIFERQESEGFIKAQIPNCPVCNTESIIIPNSDRQAKEESARIKAKVKSVKMEIVKGKVI